MLNKYRRLAMYIAIEKGECGAHENSELCFYHNWEIFLLITMPQVHHSPHNKMNVGFFMWQIDDLQIAISPYKIVYK